VWRFSWQVALAACMHGRTKDEICSDKSMKSTKSSQATSASRYPIPASITTNLIRLLDFEIVLLESDQNVRLCADENPRVCPKRVAGASDSRRQPHGLGMSSGVLSLFGRLRARRMS
jgi:hypothetical protein